MRVLCQQVPSRTDPLNGHLAPPLQLHHLSRVQPVLQVGLLQRRKALARERVEVRLHGAQNAGQQRLSVNCHGVPPPLLQQGLHAGCRLVIGDVEADAHRGGKAVVLVGAVAQDAANFEPIGAVQVVGPLDPQQ